MASQWQYPYDYHDILLLGKTGQGKSTTGNKLLGLNGDGSGNSDCDLKGLSLRNVGMSPDSKGLDTEQRGVSDDTEWEELTDILGSSKDSPDSCTDELHGPELEDPHTEGVGKGGAEENLPYFVTGEGANSVTLRPKVIANDKTRVRVCDTQGFAQSGRSAPVVQANLELIRQVLSYQKELKLQFRRVLYFLPCTGAPQRADGVLSDEIAILHHYFGKSIWERTKVVVTVSPRYSRQRYIAEFGDPVEDTKKPLSEVLRVVAERYKETIKCPDVIFLAYDDDCDRVKQAVEVHGAEGVLSIRQDVCLKCAVLVTFDTDCEDNDHTEAGDVPLAPVRKGPIPILHGKCHPQFKKARKLLFWSEERCVWCKARPGGEPGCTAIGVKYGKERYLVEHETSQSLEKLKLQL